MLGEMLQIQAAWLYLKHRNELDGALKTNFPSLGAAANPSEFRHHLNFAGNASNSQVAFELPVGGIDLGGRCE